MNDPGAPPSKISGWPLVGAVTNIPHQWVTWFYNFYQWVKHSMGRDFYFDVAAGHISGYSSVNKFGGNASIADGAVATVWDGGGTYSFPTTADITHIRQAADQAAMRGETIEVQGLDANWKLTVQTVLLNAANTSTPVALTTPLRRVFRMKAQTSVVTSQNVELRNVGGGTTYAIIQAGLNQTLMAIYTVPAGKTAFISKYYGTGKGSAPKIPDSIVLRVWGTDNANGYAPQLKHVTTAETSGTSMVEHEFIPPVKFSEKFDIYITAQPDGAEADVVAGFDLILEDMQ